MLHVITAPTDDRGGSAAEHQYILYIVGSIDRNRINVMLTETYTTSINTVRSRLPITPHTQKCGASDCGQLKPIW
jgi:hypothetical protein